MVFLVITLVWSVVASMAGVWLGTAMRIADRHDGVRGEVEVLFRREFAGL